MERTKKIQIVTALKSKINRAQSAFLAEFKGMNFVELSELRRLLRLKNGEINIARNTLLRRAVSGTILDQLSEYLEGPNAIIFGYGDGTDIAKVLMETSRKQPFLKVKAGIIEGNVLDARGVDFISRLPARNELQAKLVLTIASPLNGTARVLAGPLRGLVIVLKEIQKKKEAA